MAGSAPVPNNNGNTTEGIAGEISGEIGAFAPAQRVDASNYATVPSLSNLESVSRQNLTGRDNFGTILDKPASGRKTPPSGFSGSNQNKSSRLAAGERFDS
jgi:hypothetical protein